MRKKVCTMRRCSYVFLLTLCFSLLSEPVIVVAKKTYYDAFAFMYGLIKDPQTVGALTPSSEYVAQELVMPLKAQTGPRTILEIGAGTGQITNTIVKSITADDTLDVVELNPDFCKILTERFKNQAHVQIFSGSILDWNPDKKYDFVICTLPFNRFSAQLVQAIIEHVRLLVKPNGFFSYIELKYLAYFKELILSAHELQQHALVTTYMKNFNQTYCKQTVTIFRNLPPAQVFHCQLTD